MGSLPAKDLMPWLKQLPMLDLFALVAQIHLY
jgi:hypothetical protein